MECPESIIKRSPSFIIQHAGLSWTVLYSLENFLSRKQEPKVAVPVRGPHKSCHDNHKHRIAELITFSGKARLMESRLAIEQV